MKAKQDTRQLVWWIDKMAEGDLERSCQWCGQEVDGLVGRKVLAVWQCRSEVGIFPRANEYGTAKRAEPVPTNKQAVVR